MSKIQFVFRYLLLNKYSYLFAFVMIFIVNWLQVEIPRYIQLAIDLLNETVTSTDVQADLRQYVMLIIALALVMIVVRILSRIYALNPGRITEAQLKNDLLGRLNRLPDSFHNRFASGKLISIINNDLNGIRLFYGIGFLQLFNVLFALSLTPIWMWRISPELTLYSALPLSIAFVIFRLGFRTLRTRHTERQRRLQDLSEQLMKHLSGIDVIKNQQMQAWISQDIERVNQRLLDCTMQITRIQTFILPVLDYANHAMKVLILGLGGYYLLQQSLSLGQITAFLSYSVLLALPLMQLGRIATVFQMGMVSIDSVLTVLNADIPDADREEKRLTEPEQTALSQGTLTVTNLCYRYDNTSDLALKNISFSITKGQKVGVLGSIGAGKSTLVNCLNHHLDVTPGQIQLGDKDITQIPRQDWRRFVRTITQEPYLFSDTVENNVRFGAESYNGTLSAEEIDLVLELSQLSDDLARFKQGKQTLVGEKGIMLSGGQKQRLSIARALLTPSDLIIMDNVLSAVDYDTERKILDGMSERLAGNSLLVVSHRISALENLDQILVLHHGEIIARGTHKELLMTSPYYRETWELQQHEAEQAREQEQDKQEQDAGRVAGDAA